jgi:hypothetical protein
MQGRIARAEETVGAVAILMAEATYGAEARDVVAAVATTETAATRVATVNLTAIIYHPLGLHRARRALERTRGRVRFSDSGPKAKKINDHSKPGANASAAPSAKDNDINKDETLTNSFSVPKAPHPPSAFKTNNPTFAALMAKRWARPEEVVYVFSSQTEQLELTKTQLGPSCVKPRPD